jgi:hypothetical protein
MPFAGVGGTSIRDLVNMLIDNSLRFNDGDNALSKSKTLSASPTNQKNSWTYQYLGKKKYILVHTVSNLVAHNKVRQSK